MEQISQENRKVRQWFLYSYIPYIAYVYSLTHDQVKDLNQTIRVASYRVNRIHHKRPRKMKSEQFSYAIIKQSINRYIDKLELQRAKLKYYINCTDDIEFLCSKDALVHKQLLIEPPDKNLSFSDFDFSDLAEDEKHIIKLHYIDGWAVTKIARQKGINSKTLKSRIDKWLVKMRSKNKHLYYKDVA